MPREDYDILINYLKNESINSNYEILTLKIGNCNIPYSKVINKNILIKGKSKEDKYLWIDIFPIDGLADSTTEAKKIMKKSMFYRKQIYLISIPFKEILSERKSMLNKIIKVMLKPIAHRHSMLYYSKKLDKLARQYKFSECNNYVGDIVWTDGERSIFKKSWFESTVEHEFEDNIFKIPIGWDEYLKNLYGNYMEIPSVKERESHKLKAIRSE